MVELTILEVHVNDSDLSASARANYDPGEKDVSAAEGSLEADSESRRAPLLGALVGLAFLVAVAYLRRRADTDDTERSDAPDDTTGIDRE
jgi:hypothetical protein